VCGIAAWLGPEPYVNVHRLLLEQQHRGHDAAGIAVVEKGRLRIWGGSGYVRDAVPLQPLGPSRGLAVGHVRYSTSGSYNGLYQPVASSSGRLVVAFNGNIFNYEEAAWEVLRRSYTWDAAAFADMIDHYLAETGSLLEAIREAARIVRGSYSLVAATASGELVAARDPRGIRPLAASISEEAAAFASETAALSALGLEWFEVGAGEAVYCQNDPHGCYVDRVAAAGTVLPCAFEYIYFLRPDSVFEGIVAHSARRRMGALLARMDDASVDVAVPVPDSGRSAAIGYAEEKGVPLDEALYRSRFSGRAFISAPGVREERLRRKLSPIPGSVEDKRVAVIDDSIVRGSTARYVTTLLRRAGAKEVHFRSASPPVRYPCFLGIDIPSRDELVASRRSVEEVRVMIGADSLLYNTVGNLAKAIGRPVCMACFTSNYPYELDIGLLEERFSRRRGGTSGAPPSLLL